MSWRHAARDASLHVDDEVQPVDLAGELVRVADEPVVVDRNRTFEIQLGDLVECLLLCEKRVAAVGRLPEHTHQSGADAARVVR